MPIGEHRKRQVAGTIAGVVFIAAIGITARLAGTERKDPARCPRGTLAIEARCCAPGQRLEGGHCTGEPAICPSGLVKTSGPAGCVSVTLRIQVPATRLTLGPNDWEAQGEVTPRVVDVEAFEVDSTEVTQSRWRVCAKAAVCQALPVTEPGLPVTNVTASAAARFCRFVEGRLPSSDEWIAAAAGAQGRRYPWGATGLVCRRAVFGLLEGPCAKGGTLPDLAGLRPDGATPDGVLDLAGNVAEWTVQPDRSHVARGGSYRSKVAGDLKSWSVEQATGPADHVGFRCAYDVGR